MKNSETHGHKLSVKWSKKENDVLYKGLTSPPDVQFLVYHLGQILEELDRRGYDIKTVKFEIYKNLPKP